MYTTTYKNHTVYNMYKQAQCSIQNTQLKYEKIKKEASIGSFVNLRLFSSYPFALLPLFSLTQRRKEENEAMRGEKNIKKK